MPGQPRKFSQGQTIEIVARFNVTPAVAVAELSVVKFCTSHVI